MTEEKNLIEILPSMTSQKKNALENGSKKPGLDNLDFFRIS